ncbi:MAG: TonB family protein [Bacteroidales bacterium]|nr:TonB family protein [Bacteroidales bacterium]
MDFIITYSLKSIFCMSIFYLMYTMLLRKETFFKLNRIILLSSFIFSIITPFFQFSFNTEKIPVNYYYTLNQVNVFANNTQEYQQSIFNTSSIFLITFLSISCIFLINFFIQIIRIKKLKHQGVIIKLSNYNIVYVDKKISPFTFFNTIFINKNDITSESTEDIIIHELIHINEFHSIDIMIIEIVKIFQWSNPFIYLFKKLIIETHEYCADSGVVEKGINKNKYQILLLKHILIKNDIYFINNFSKSLIKRRLKMLNKKKSKKIIGLKTLIVIPVSIFLIFALACTNSKKENKKIKETKIEETKKVKTIETAVKNDSVYLVVDIVPKFPNGEKARLNYIASNIKYPKEAREKGIQGTVYVTFIIEADGSVTNARILRGIGGGCDKEALRVIENMPKWIAGKQDGKPVRVQFNMPIKFSLEK